MIGWQRDGHRGTGSPGAEGICPVRLSTFSSLSLFIIAGACTPRSSVVPTPARSTLRLGDEVRASQRSSASSAIRGCLLAAKAEFLTLCLITDTTTGTAQPKPCARDTLAVVEHVPWSDDVVVAIRGWEAVSRGLATPRRAGWEGPTPAALSAGIGAVGCAVASLTGGDIRGAIMAPLAAIVCGFIDGTISLIAFGNEPIVRAGPGVRLEVEPWVTVPDARDQLRQGVQTPRDSTACDR